MNEDRHPTSVTSSFTGQKDAVLVERISVDMLIKAWDSQFDIDVRSYFEGMTHVALYECQRTRCQFFLPESVQSKPGLYAELSTFDWYYGGIKWEHRTAINDAKGAKNLLEFGCGDGAFLDHARVQLGVDAYGVDFFITETPPQTKVYEQADAFIDAGIKFDVVCAFQYLEHIVDPELFFERALELLNPNGGKLIVSVPNRESFRKYIPLNVLDSPPHHMTRWCEETFQLLTNYYPLKVMHILSEPLAPYHVAWYASIQKERLKAYIPFNWLNAYFEHGLRAMLNYSAWLREQITGHTLYVCYAVGE